MYPPILISALLIAIAPLVCAQSSNDPVLGESPFETEPEHFALEKIGQWPGYLRGFFREIATDGEKIYVAARSGGLHSFDLSDPANPEPVLGSELVTSASDVFTDNGRLYIRSGREFKIFDTSVPDTVELLATSRPDEFFLSPLDTTAADGYIYYQVFGNVHILDTNKPENLGGTPAATTPLFSDFYSVTAVHRQGDLLIAAAANSIRVFDLSTSPGAPPMLWEGVMGLGIADVAGTGELLGIATTNGIIVADVSEPDFPIARSVVGNGTEFLEVAMTETYLVGITRNEIHAFDITNPGAPVPLGMSTSAEPIWDVAVVGNHAYATAGNNGILTVDLSAALPAAPANAFSDNGFTEHFVVVGDRVFVSDGSRGLFLLDVSDPAAPIELTQIPNPTPSSITDLQITGGRLYIGVGGSGILIYDIETDLDNPVLLGQLEEIGEFVAIGNLIYHVLTESGLNVYDASNPIAISNPGIFPPVDGRLFLDIQVQNGIAYVAAGDAGVSIFEVNNPAQIRFRGDFAATGRSATAVNLSDGMLFVELQDGDTEPSTEIYDLTIPLLPQSMSRFDLCCGTGKSGDIAYFANVDFRLYALDISVPTFPVSVAGYDTFGQASQVEAIGDRVYVANGSAGLLILARRPWEASLSNPHLDDSGNFSFDAQVPTRNLFRVRTSRDLRNLSVPGSDAFFERAFTGTGEPINFNSLDELNQQSQTLGPRRFYQLRGGAGLVLDPPYYDR